MLCEWFNYSAGGWLAGRPARARIYTLTMAVIRFYMLVSLLCAGAGHNMNLVPGCTLGLATRTIYGRARSLHAPSLCKLKAVAASYFSRDTRIDFQFVAVVGTRRRRAGSGTFLARARAAFIHQRALNAGKWCVIQFQRFKSGSGFAEVASLESECGKMWQNCPNTFWWGNAYN